MFAVLNTSMVNTAYFRQNESYQIKIISAIEQLASVRAKDLLRLKQNR
jgi:hypothetical protein